VETTVRLFATLREAAGTGTATVEHPDGATVREVLDELAADRPALRERLYADVEGTGESGSGSRSESDGDGDRPDLAAHLNLTADGEPVAPDAVVTTETELAVYPPVSGG
jgi:molybdopterin converting factor small subunit